MRTMRVLFGRLAVALSLSTTLVAQTPAPTASFDAADVHVRPHSSNANQGWSGGILRLGRYDVRDATMLDLITLAYGVDTRTILGGPSWLARNRFDIIAKAPDSTPRAQLPIMLQSLLAERFKLVVHKDTQPIPSYLLTVSGASKMKSVPAPTGDAANQPCQFAQNSAQTTGGIAFNVFSCHGVTMDQFAKQLQGGIGQGYVSGRVVDQTALSGNFDFDLKWTARNMLSRAGSEAIPLTAALEQQLGLQVTFGKAPGDVLVVDSVNDTPTPNPSGTAQNLPAPPPGEFDVAEIKIAPPDAQASGRLQPSGRVDLQGITMKALFDLAWDINDDDLLAGAPKWFDTTKYSLVAKTTAISADPNNPNNTLFDIADVQAMLRALLIDRFKIVTHIEQRPIDAYALVVADKPKLQAADPANRTTWFNGPAPGAKDLRDLNPALNRLITAQNMSMAQFAEDLSTMAGGYLKEPVVDATGLQGSWDFVLNFSGINVVNAGRGGDASAGALAASAPTGALSLFDALQKQLGLKLEQRKRPFPVLVIDHIEEQPIDR